MGTNGEVQMMDVTEFQCIKLQEHVQHIKNNFENFKSPYPNPQKDLYKKELDGAIPRFWEYLHTFSPTLQQDREVQQMHQEVNRIQAALSMNLPSTTDKPSGKNRLNILS